MQIKKIIVIGDESVGKTSIINIFQNKNYSHPINTHACSNIKLDIQVQGLNQTVQITDTPGLNKDSYLDKIKMILPQADGVIIVFNVNDYDSYESVTTKWIPIINLMCRQDVQKIIFANQVDLLENREAEMNDSQEKQVEDEDLQNLEKTLSIQVIQTSIKLKEGIKDSFVILMEKIVNQMALDAPPMRIEPQFIRDRPVIKQPEDQIIENRFEDDYNQMFVEQNNKKYERQMEQDHEEEIQQAILRSMLEQQSLDFINNQLKLEDEKQSMLLIDQLTAQDNFIFQNSDLDYCQQLQLQFDEDEVMQNYFKEDPLFLENQQKYFDLVEQTKLQNSLRNTQNAIILNQALQVIQQDQSLKQNKQYLNPETNKFDIKDLQNGVPNGVNPAKKEEYLVDLQFSVNFNDMSLDDFRNLPDHEKESMKKQAGLL